MLDAEEEAADSLVRSGLVDEKTSRRIVREVVRAVFEAPEMPVRVHSADINAIQEIAAEIDSLVWDIEEDPAGDHRPKLLLLTDHAQHILRITKTYLAHEALGLPEVGI